MVTIKAPSRASSLLQREAFQADERAVLEQLLQDAATPRALADATLAWLDAPSKDPQRLQALQTKFAALHQDLQRDTATIATDAIQKVLQT